MEEEGILKRRPKETININIPIDNGLTVPSCYKILEDLLKYFLYQRHQIPLQYEILLKSLEQESDNGLLTLFPQTTCCSRPTNNRHRPLRPSWKSREECNEPNESEMKKDSHELANDQYIHKVYHSNEEIQNKKRDRKIKQWLVKVTEFIESFRKVTQILRFQLESGRVTAVSFVLGSCVTAGCEMYSVSLPSNFNTSQKNSCSERHLAMQFFRAFVTNDDILRFMSRKCSIKKMWVMFQKKNETVLTSHSNWFSSAHTKSSASSDDVNDCIIPRPCFQPSYRSKAIHISLEMPPPSEMSMELTPSVGKGLEDHVCTPFMKMPAKRTLGFNVPRRTKRLSAESISQELSQCICSSPLFIKSIEAKRYESDAELVSRKCAICDFNQHKTISKVRNNYENSYMYGLPLTPCTPSLDIRSSNKHSMSIVETPTVSSTSRVKSIYSSKSPSKFLVSKIDNFKLSDNDRSYIKESDRPSTIYDKEGRTWFVIDQSIKGFKNTFF